MHNLSDIKEIKYILEKFGFSFSKSLGQNFIVNPGICPKIAESAEIGERDGVLEIGPGIGVLTSELAKKAAKVVAIELDKRLPAILNYTLEDFNNVKIIGADALKIDLRAVIDENFSDCEDVHICANIPYYITSPLIMKLLEDKLPVKDITVMVQKEAADRLCAEVGTRASGAITVAVNYFAVAQKLFTVSRGSFMPSPNVDSAAIKLTVRDNPDIAVDEEFFFKMVKAAFSKRRKTAVNAISTGMNIPKEQVASALEESGLECNVRAETMNMNELAALCGNLQRLL